MKAAKQNNTITKDNLCSTLSLSLSLSRTFTLYLEDFFLGGGDNVLGVSPPVSVMLMLMVVVVVVVVLVLVVIMFM